MTCTDERSTRIVETAVYLAEEGGYEAVRLREVATRAQVALGTLYKRFRSKEDMLIAALGLEFSRVEVLQRGRPPRGETPELRADDATHLYLTLGTMDILMIERFHRGRI
ncbi:MAG: AcrR family transcriptional regulator [Myxococcota bacterium]|jgi:AcrR family transcriptional regulator